MAGADRGLIEQIASVRGGQIMQIIAVCRIRDRTVHHSIIVAAEDIDLLIGNVVRSVDISVASPLVGLSDQRL